MRIGWTSASCCYVTLFANLLAATGMAALIFSDLIFSTSNVQFWHAYIVMLIGGIGWGLDMPSRRTIVLDVLGRARVNNAIALDSVGMHSSRMLGPLIGGGLISISLFFAFERRLRTRGWLCRDSGILHHVSGDDAECEDAASRCQRNYAGFTEHTQRISWKGIRYVGSEATLLAVVLITVFMNLLLFPYQQLIPVVASEVLHVGPTLMGLLLAFEGNGGVDGFNSDSVGI